MLPLYLPESVWMFLKRYSTYTNPAALALFCCLGTLQASEASEDPHYLPDDLKHDLVSAHIPYPQAATAAVALAKLNIILYEAKSIAENKLCDGGWMPRGKALKHIGPRPVLTPATGGKSWHYRSLREANNLACPQVTRAEFFVEMSRHLPEWVVVRPAGQLTAFRQGLIYPLPPSAVASR